MTWALIKKIFHGHRRKDRASLGVKCSFCGKAEEEVKKLFAGPEVYICNECIDLSSGLINEQLGARAFSPRRHEYSQ